MSRTEEKSKIIFKFEEKNSKTNNEKYKEIYRNEFFQWNSKKIGNKNPPYISSYVYHTYAPRRARSEGERLKSLADTFLYASASTLKYERETDRERDRERETKRERERDRKREREREKERKSERDRQREKEKEQEG